MRQGLFLFLFLILILPAISKAATIEVPKDYDSIQEALNVPRPGDVIAVSSGTYRESLAPTTARSKASGVDIFVLVRFADFYRV